MGKGKTYVSGVSIRIKRGEKINQGRQEKFIRREKRGASLRTESRNLAHLEGRVQGGRKKPIFWPTGNVDLRTSNEMGRGTIITERGARRLTQKTRRVVEKNNENPSDRGEWRLQ